MNLVKRLNNNPVVFIIFIILIPVVGLIASLYFGVYYERKPNISLVVLNSINVLDVHEPVKDLSIEFQGKDIQKEELSLRIFKVKMVNDGSVNILQNQYDMNEKWGIKVDGGEIIEVRLIDSSSEYIKSNIAPKLLKDESLIEFDKIMFDKGSYFILDILVLHEKQEFPIVSAVGKVAGIEEIKVSEAKAESEKTSFVNEVFSGSPLAQATRTFSYFLFFVFILILILLLGLILSGINNARRKNSKKKEFWRLLSGIEGEAKRQYSRQLEILANIYAIRGKESLKIAKDLIEAGSRGESRIKEWLWRRNPLDGLSPLEEIKRQKDINAMEKATRIMAVDEELEERDIAMELVDKIIVSEGKDKELLVDEDFKKLLDGLVKDSEEI
ncbi:MAG: hypothetical protein V1653_02495 [bacterium]